MEYTGKRITDFTERFIELIDNSPLSDTEISRALNVSKQTVSSWKVGRRSPKKPTIITIAQYFHVNIEWLMGYDVEKYIDHGVSLDNTLIDMMTDLSPSEAHRVRDFVSGLKASRTK